MPLLNMSMQGRVCLITGANSGIGKATALGLAQMDAMVVTVRCINVNRTPFLDKMLDDPLVGIHNDYQEPEIFQAAVAISLLKPGSP